MNRLGCIWEESRYSGFGRIPKHEITVRTHKCAECPYKPGGKDCKTVMAVYHADTLTKDRYDEIMLYGYARKPKLPQESVDFIKQARFHNEDDDGGEPQISFSIVSLTEDLAELGILSIEAEGAEA